MIDISYQKIYSTLSDSLPNEWKKLIVYAAFSESGRELRYYIQVGNGEYIDCFELGLPLEKVLSNLINISSELTQVRDKLGEKDKWSVVTVLIDSKGNFKSDFDYSKDAWKSISYVDKWKENYLK